MRAVLAVGRIDDQGVEAFCLRLAEQVGADVAAKPVEIMVVDVHQGGRQTPLLEHRCNGLHVRPNGL